MMTDDLGDNHNHNHHNHHNNNHNNNHNNIHNNNSNNNIIRKEKCLTVNNVSILTVNNVSIFLGQRFPVNRPPVLSRPIPSALKIQITSTA